MADDKRRIPYNIWVCMLGVVIFLVIASVGVGIISLGVNAKSKVVISEEDTYCTECMFGGFKTEYTYDNGLTLRDNGALGFCKVVVWLVGFGVIVLGGVAGGYYGNSRWWYEGEKSHSLDK